MGIERSPEALWKSLAGVALGLAGLVHEAQADGGKQETDTVKAHYDLVEYNNYYSQDTGDALLDQIIYYRWCNRKDMFIVEDWRIVPTTPVEKPLEVFGDRLVNKTIEGKKRMVVEWHKIDSQKKYKDLLPTERGKSMIPQKKNGEYSAVWQDGDVKRKITTDSFRETWTTYDPELENRDVHPKDGRSLLPKKLAEFLPLKP